MRWLLCVTALACSVFGQIRGDQGDGVLPLGPFSGGMVNTRNAYNLAANELSDAQNCDFSQDGEVLCRNGHGVVGAIKGDFAIAGMSYPDGQQNGTPSNYLFIATTDMSGDPDTIWYYVSTGSAPTLVLRDTLRTTYYGVPSVDIWKAGYLFHTPTYTAAADDTSNCVRYVSNYGTASFKIGVPTCSTIVSSAGMDGWPKVVGTYYYAATIRREYTVGGRTYYEEGNSILDTALVGAESQGKRLGLVTSRLTNDWKGARDGYNGSYYFNIYRTKADGSVLYWIDSISADSSLWYDSIPDANVNVFGPTYGEVEANYCLDTLMGNFRIRGQAIHDNRLYVLTETNDGSGLAQTRLYRTVPFVNQTPLLFNSTRMATSTSATGLYKTGLISCGGVLYSYGLGGLYRVAYPNSSIIYEDQLSSMPISGANCVECVDGGLWAMSTMGKLYAPSAGAVGGLRVNLVDSSEYWDARQWGDVSSNLRYKTYSFNVVKPFGKPILLASNDSSGTWAGYPNGSGLAWSRFTFGARSLVGGAPGNQVFWVDTATNKLEYWPEKRFAYRDYNGTDSANIEWTMTTGWHDAGSFDAVKQIKRISVDADLVDTMYIYTYWDGSSTVSDSGTIFSQDTVVSTHSGNCYSWYPKRTSSVGRYVKVKFRHPSCTSRKIRFRSAKLYYTYTQR